MLEPPLQQCFTPWEITLFRINSKKINYVISKNKRIPDTFMSKYFKKKQMFRLENPLLCLSVPFDLTNFLNFSLSNLEMI